MVIDSHVHIVDSGEPLRDMMRKIQSGLSNCGFDRWCFAINTSEGIHAVHRNLLAFLFKMQYPESTYIFAGLDYHIPGTGFDNFGFAYQAGQMLGTGIEGYKMYEGKPGCRRICGNIPLTSAKYSGFFELMAEKKTPVSIHLGDPPEFWDASKLTPYQVSKGWFFGDMTFASWQDIYDETFTLIRQYRAIPFILPQFGYIFPDLDKMAALLEDNPNLYFDVAPAGSNYSFMTENAAACRSFFNKYRNRFFLACSGVCENWADGAKKAQRIMGSLKALELDSNALESIMGGNFKALCPLKPLNPEAIKKYASFVKEHIMVYSVVPEYSAIVKRTVEAADAIEASTNF